MAYPSDPYQKLQYHMDNTHNTYKLGYETILPHLDNPPLDDLDNFLGYCRAWATSIVEHHDSEEEVLFPFLNQKLDFSTEITQHVVVADGLEAIIKYIDESRSEPSKFEGSTLKELMQKLHDPLWEHLDQEVADLSPTALRVFTPEELAQAAKNLMVYIRAHSDAFITLPFMRSHTPAELKEVWPPFPWFMKRIIVPYVLAWKYSGYWKYAPFPIS
ncbi:hypothetical protein B0H10DRAFT_2159604 [Mycena sp. CBHHK59/15]|nr:hypothetical protein B0H10DRAFT_2159604 [Mycena sp. CBHHK59/15]